MNWPRLGMLLSTLFAFWCCLVGDDCRAEDANRNVPVVQNASQRKSAPSITGVAFSPDGSWLAVARGAEVALLDVATGATKFSLKGATQNINAVAVSPDGSRVAAAGGESGISGEVLVWTLPNPEPKRFVGHTDSIYAVAYNADGSRLVTASYDKLLLLWNAATGEVVSTLRHHTAPVYSAQFSPDGKSILSGGADQTVKLWSAETGERLLTLSEATKGINAVVFHPKGLEFAAAGIDRTIRVYEWNGTTARLKRAAFAHDAPVLTLAYSPDGATLFSGSEDRRVKAWEVATLRERHIYEELSDWPLTLAVDPAGTRLACGLFNGSLPLFEPASTKRVRDLVSALKAQHTSEPLIIAAAAVQEQAPPTPSAAEPAPPKPNPPMPRLDSISPRTVVRGQKVKLTLSGQNIADADRLFVSHGRLTATLLPGDPKNANQVSCEIELPADFEPELVTLRLHTPLGSTAARSFYVGPFAEVGEMEPNNSREVATPVTLPATLTGAIAVRGDIDVWSFDASEGQELVFHLTGPNLGSSLQARMTVRDMHGQRLASQVRRTGRSEVTLGFRVPQAGKYTLEIQDRDNTGGGNHYYYVHAGLFPFVTGVFPLAVRGADQGERGANEVTDLSVTGFNLDGVAPISPAPGAGGRSPIVQTKLGVSLNAVRYEQSRFAEFTENEPNDDPRLAQVVTIPSGVSGRMHTLDQIGTDVDHFAFTARQGERLTVEVIARRIGSPMDSVIEILDAEGRVLPRQTLRSVSETYTELRDHDSRSKGIRLHNWEDFLPGDLILLGGELAKIQILPLGPDEDVKFFDRGGVRLGYLGTTPEAHALNRFAYKVEVHSAGQKFPPNGMPVVDLPWRNDDGGPGFQSDSVLWFDAPADGNYIVRLRDVRARGGLDATYRLVIRERQEDFRVAIDPENPNVPRGGALPVNVTIQRLDNFNGPVDVRLEGLPPGFTSSTTRIGPDLVTGVIQIASDKDTPQPQGDEGLRWKVVATGQVDGKVVESFSTPGFGAHQVTVTSPPDLKVFVKPRLAAIEPGQQVRFTVTIERRNGFQGRVPVDVLNLPHGLQVLDVGLNGVLINENETSRSFVVSCDPWATAGKWVFFAAPKVEQKNERHGSALLTLEVKTPPEAARKESSHERK